jgi:hypothetical protein
MEALSFENGASAFGYFSSVRLSKVATSAQSLRQASRSVWVRVIPYQTT